MLFWAKLMMGERGGKDRNYKAYLKIIKHISKAFQKIELILLYLTDDYTYWL
jgi:hypothetical protein